MYGDLFIYIVIEMDLKKNLVCIKEIKQFNIDNSGIDESVLKELYEVIAASKKAEIESKLREIKIMEMELNIYKAEVVQYQTKLILDVYRNHCK